MKKERDLKQDEKPTPEPFEIEELDDFALAAATSGNSTGPSINSVSQCGCNVVAGCGG